MADKPVINEWQFIDEMNALIPTYDGYQGGKVMPSPHGYGYAWDGPKKYSAAFMSRASAEVKAKFTLQVSQINKGS